MPDKPKRYYFMPGTASLSLDLKDIFVCPCGEELTLDGVHLAAHWNDHITRMCDRCEQIFDVKSGVITKR